MVWDGSVMVFIFWIQYFAWKDWKCIVGVNNDGDSIAVNCVGLIYIVV